MDLIKIFLVLSLSLIFVGCISPKPAQEPSLVPEIKLTLDRNQLEEVFLLSDQNWQEILPWIPSLIWSEKSQVYAHPLFILPAAPTPEYTQAFQVLIKQLNPPGIVFVGDNSEKYNTLLSILKLDQKKVEQISAKGYLAYWEDSYAQVVYVENSYETALLASVYASWLNSPLVIQGTAAEKAKPWKGKKVILVGSLSCPPEAQECFSFSLEQLQQEYRKQTGTEKVILVSTNDLFSSRPSISLQAPILAAGKQELLLSTDLTDLQSIDAFLAQKLSSLGITSGYLAIMAHPQEIPMETEIVIKAAEGRNFLTSSYAVEVDNRFYGTLGENLIGEVDLGVGRIFGEGTSLYLVRDLFFERLPKNHQQVLIAALSTESGAETKVGAGEFNSNQGTILWTKEIRQNLQQQFSQLFTLWGDGIELTEAKALSQEERNLVYQQSSFIYYHGHGGPNGLYSFNLQKKDLGPLNLPVIVTTACSTCDTSSDPDPFCTRNLLWGARGYIGAFEDGLNMGYVNIILEKMYKEGLTLGEVMREVKNLKQCAEPLDQCIYEKRAGEMRRVLIGDPTLKAKWW